MNEGEKGGTASVFRISLFEMTMRKILWGLCGACLVAIAFVQPAGAAENTVGDTVAPKVIRVQIPDDDRWYIQKIEVREKDGDLIVRGRVRPGNRSHVPALYAGHIDLFIKQPDKTGELVKSIDLRGRQQYFAAKIHADTSEGTYFIARYSKNVTNPGVPAP